MKVKKLIDSFSFAIEGIRFAFRTERNLRIHFLATTLVLLFALLLGLTKIEMIILFFTISLVIIMELVNTGIEHLVDMVSPQYSTKAKVAKNVAAGAVLVTAINAVMVGLLIFSSRLKLSAFSLDVINRIRTDISYFSMVLFIVILIVVFFIKARLKENNMLRGGMPSGHSALAFSLATLLVFLNFNIFSVLIGYLLAALVAQSRVDGEIHTTAEVIWGAVVGTLVTVLLFRFFWG